MNPKNFAGTNIDLKNIPNEEGFYQCTVTSFEGAGWEFAPPPLIADKGLVFVCVLFFCSSLSFVRPILNYLSMFKSRSLAWDFYPGSGNSSGLEKKIIRIIRIDFASDLAESQSTFIVC